LCAHIGIFIFVQRCQFGGDRVSPIFPVIGRSAIVAVRSAGTFEGRMPRSPAVGASSAALNQQLPETSTPESTMPHMPRDTVNLVNRAKLQPAIISCSIVL